jgi:hypothetical protein
MPTLPRRRIIRALGRPWADFKLANPGTFGPWDSCSRLVAHGVRGPRSRSGTSVSPSFLRSPRRPGATLEYRSVSRKSSIRLRRRLAPPPPKPRPAGQDSARGLFAPRNGGSAAPLGGESQFFLDHLVAGFRLSGSWAEATAPRGLRGANRGPRGGKLPNSAPGRRPV